MSTENNIDHLILGHLKAIRGDVGAIKSDVHDIKTRLLGVESHQAAFYTDIIGQRSKLQEMDERLQHIENRLDLKDN